MAKANELGVTPQHEDFAAWYNDVVQRAELAERGPARGTMIIRPYGYRIWELLQAELDRRIKATGHDNAYFPIFIPQSYFQREAEHVEGFAPELAIVTRAGNKTLEEPLVVRPTSETVIGESFARWISSYRDLPLLINQWANVVRWELRPRLLLRTTEFLWQEGHTAHASEADATAEMFTALSIYEEVARDVALLAPVVGEKTAGERFAGAVRTFTLEPMMRDGRALQAGTSHYLGTNFAQVFGIRFTSEQGREELCHTTSWGMSTRMLGGIVMSHGDDKGLILPPDLAPHQVVVVPIARATDDAAADVHTHAAQLVRALNGAGVRAHLDDRRQHSPGFKFNHWELSGVPLRVELGPRDLAAGTATVANRLTGAKSPVPIERLEAELPAQLSAFAAALKSRAEQFRAEHTTCVTELAELLGAVTTGFAEARFCGRERCADAVKSQTGATPRCILSDAEPDQGPCAICGEPSAYATRVLFGRSY
jgi:prolyl-tRNA synthetase